jgi:hypothetical protein
MPCARNRPVLVDGDGAPYCDDHAKLAAPGFEATLGAYDALAGSIRDLADAGGIDRGAMSDYFDLVGDALRGD